MTEAGRSLADAERRVRVVEQRLQRWSVLTLGVIGIWLIMAPLVPGASGWEFLSGALGDGGVSRILLGFLFLYFGGIVKEKNQLRETLHGMVGIIRDHLESRQERVVSEAVPILLEAAESDDAEVRKKVFDRLRLLTQQEIADDAEAWKRWWRDQQGS